MSNKRVHEIAKERGLAPKDVLARLKEAGIDVKASSSSVDEEVASRVLANGGQTRPSSGSGSDSGSSVPAKAKPAAEKAKAKPADGAKAQAKSAERAKTEPAAQPAQASAKAAPAPRAATPAPSGEKSAPAPAAAAATDAGDSARAEQPAGDGRGQGHGAGGDQHKRPTRDSLQGERAPGNAGGRRRVVIDSQASRRGPGGTGGPPQSNQPPRRQRRGRRRRGVYDEEAESRPSRTPSSDPTVIQVNSGSTVKDVAEYLDVSTSEIIKKLMGLGEMRTLTQTLSDDTIEVLATELGKEIEIVHSEDE
ncbi:MAG TPA: translation initiation factor IF-2 N-terminal domain-containing protein, partial [Solirubrobacteraceae bacterium]|nr:translation initiation factor IF-2 N-terminal domain-containing protein [Solirubrobacteraceae bacterium]